MAEARKARVRGAPMSRSKDLCVSPPPTDSDCSTRGYATAARWAACCLLGILLGFWTGTAESDPLSTTIVPQPLATALADFAHQTGLQLVYVSQIVAGHTSKGAQAGLSPIAALTELLDGTGLTFQFLNERTVRIFEPVAVAPTTQSTGTDASTKHVQRRPPPGLAPDLDEVVVTGSHLNRSLAETASPVLIITREELSNAGVQTSQELLERITMNQSFGSANETIGLASGVQGFTAASLRGLGSQRTLVLLDGERLAPYALSGGQGVDLSGIPLAALERVEVLKDGASAIYGTDAIGGVMNFILRHDYQGAEVNANYFATEHGGGDNGRISATAGAGDLAADQYNAFITADYLSQQPLYAFQRDSTTTGYLPWLGLDRTSPYSFPANITQPGGFGRIANPTIPYPGGATAASCLSPLSFQTANAPFQCRFDPAHLIETIPELDKLGVLARFTRQLTTQQQFFAEAFYYQGTFTERIAPAPVSSNFTNTPMTLPPTSAFYPAAYVASLANGDVSLPLELNYRTVDLGPRVNRLTSELWRGVLGLRGELGGWDYALIGNYAANRQLNRYLSGFLFEPDFGPLLRSGVVDPFRLNTAAIIQEMRATEFTGWANDNRASNYGGTYRVTRLVWPVPGGPVALGFGVEGRRESLEQRSSDAYANRDIIGGSGTTAPSLPLAHRTVWAMFGEVNIPFASTFETDLALRYDDYSDFGSATNPKVSLRWRPLPPLVLRAAYGTGFRVPTLSDLFQPPGAGFAATVNAFDDPLRCPVTHSPNDCGVNFNVRSGGNPALDPEKSQQWGAGLLFGPQRGLTASLDYFHVEIRDVIDTLQGDEIFSDYALWAPTHVVRGSPDAQYPNLPGPIDYVIQDQVNFGSIRTSGLDADIRYVLPATPVGQLTFALVGTYTLDYNRAGINTALFPTGVGTRGPDGAIVRWRHDLTLDWSRGQWGATLTQTFQDSYREVNLLSCDQNFNCPGTRRVSSYSLWDLQGRYGGISHLTLSLGVRNLLDAPPPISNQNAEMQAGIDPTYADPRGRMYYVAFRYAAH
jgi:iron complex outermembrane receptor protein